MTAGSRATLSVAIAAVVGLPLYWGDSALLVPLRPATHTQAVALAAILKSLGVEVFREGTVVRHSQGFALEIRPACVAWMHALLFLVGLSALPMALTRKVIVGALGTVTLWVANLVRLVALFAVGLLTPVHFDLAHRVLGEAFLMACVLLLWWGLAVPFGPSRSPSRAGFGGPWTVPESPR